MKDTIGRHRSGSRRRAVLATFLVLLGVSSALVMTGPSPLRAAATFAENLLSPRPPTQGSTWTPAAANPPSAAAERSERADDQRDRRARQQERARRAQRAERLAAERAEQRAVRRRTAAAAALPPAAPATDPVLVPPAVGAVPAAPAPATPVGGAAAFTVASFNILGSNHTRGPAMPGYAEGGTRAQWATELILQRRFDVVGLQEIQVDQLQVLTSASGGALATYPPVNERGVGVPQMIAWRTDTWDVVAASTFTIPFVGQQRPQPLVLLQHKASGRQVWFVNVHLAPKRARRDAEGERDAGTAIMLDQVRELLPGGIPIVVVGDMNEHGEIYCDLAGGAGLTSPLGGSMAGGCRPPRSRIDWIFGTPDLSWGPFAYQEDAAVRRITDHPIAVSRAFLPAG